MKNTATRRLSQAQFRFCQKKRMNQETVNLAVFAARWFQTEDLHYTDSFRREKCLEKLRELLGGPDKPGLLQKKIGATCLDVYEEESGYFYEDFSGEIISDEVLSRLISLPNVIVTSHQAFLTKEALENIADTTIENLITLEKEGSSPNEVK